MSLYNLDKIFQPASIAVIGASEKTASIGRALMDNLTESEFPGGIFAVNPNHARVLGFKAHSKVTDIPEKVELAVVAAPIAKVPEIVAECVDAGVKGAIIISAGGRETGAEGKKLEAGIKKIADKGSLRIIGPNSMGVICPGNQLNASFAAHMAPDGNLAFVSQSGAICSAMLDLSLKEKMGYRYFVSIGSMLDVDFGDLIDYVGSDSRVKSVLLYIESLTHFRKFMSAVRAVSRMKPVIILKSGRSRAGIKAASSHTGAMAGEDAVYDAAFKRAGAVRVNTIGDFFNCAELLAKQVRPRGKRMTVLTNSGGPGVMAADAIAHYKLQPSELSEDTVRQLNAVLPPYWSRGNPIDILGDATAERYADAVNCLRSDEMDGLLVILNPQAVADPAEVAGALAKALKKKTYPVFTSWMGGRDVEKGIEILNSAGIPTYDTPEQAIKAFKYLYDYGENLKLLQEIPPQITREFDFDRQTVSDLVREGLKRDNGLLTEVESKKLLKAYGIPTNPTEKAASIAEAQEIAGRLGFPLAMKICSTDIVHKSEAGGVQLDLRSESDLQRAYEKIMHNVREYRGDAEIQGVSLQTMNPCPDLELLIGARKDPGFGPVILFGAGGIQTEVLNDRNIGIAPLNRLLARRLMEGTRIFALLKGYRNRPPADIKRLEEMLVCLSHLLVDFPEIAELDMNPVILDSGRPCAVDARVIVKPAEVAAPYHLVISAYPEQYEYPGVLTDGLRLLIRPIKPEDAPMLVDLFNAMSWTSRYYRFFSPMKLLPQDMLVRFTQIDYDREMALVALDESRNAEQILGVARVIGNPDGQEGEFAVVVGDAWQGKGVGAELLKRCLRIVRERGMRTVRGFALRENEQMVKLARKLGFEVSIDADTHDYNMTIDLSERRAG
jgi:acetyltransferase